MGTRVVWGRLSEDQAAGRRTASVPVLVLAQPPSSPAGCVGPLWAQGGVLLERHSQSLALVAKTAFPEANWVLPQPRGRHLRPGLRAMGALSHLSLGALAFCLPDQQASLCGLRSLSPSWSSGHPAQHTAASPLCRLFCPPCLVQPPRCSTSLCSSEWSGEHLPPCRLRARAEPCPLQVTVSPGPALCPFVRCPQLTPTRLHFDHTCSYWWQRQVADGQPQRLSACAQPGVPQATSGSRSQVWC